MKHRLAKRCLTLGFLLCTASFVTSLVSIKVILVQTPFDDWQVGSGLGLLMVTDIAPPPGTPSRFGVTVVEEYGNFFWFVYMTEDDGSAIWGAPAWLVAILLLTLRIMYGRLLRRRAYCRNCGEKFTGDIPGLCLKCGHVY